MNANGRVMVIRLFRLQFNLDGLPGRKELTTIGGLREHVREQVLKEAVRGA